MKLEKFRYDDAEVNVVILKFTGEFDTFNLPGFSERIDRMIALGDVKMVLDLHLLKFINSAALGYLIKTHKAVKEKGGEMVLARPSKFLKKTLVTLGLDGVFKIFDTVENAISHFKNGKAVGQIKLEGAEHDESLTGAVPILFRTRTPGPDTQPPNQVGRIVTLYEDGLLFRYEPQKGAKGADPVKGALKEGSKLKLKFRQPFVLKDYYFEMDADIVQVSQMFGVEDQDEGILTVKVRYDKVKDEDRRHLEQFWRDQDDWKSELKK
jgi:anti-anti-sigma factor